VAAIAPEDFTAALSALVEPTDGLFEFGARLSGAGIVAQTLKAPETDRPFFGLVGEDGFRIVRVADPTHISPFEPIIDGEFVPHKGKTAVRLKLWPHPRAGFAGDLLQTGSILLFVLVGVVLAIGTWRGEVGVFAGLGGLVGFGALAVLGKTVPARRARAGFEFAAEEAVVLLVKALKMQRILGDSA
jgi:hypothetical protein